MSTTAVFFPFDLFGSAGTAAGVAQLAEAIGEVIADNRREQVETRATCYMPHLRIKETHFETLADLQNWRRRGRQLARSILNKGEFLLWFSGNHLGVLPVYEELANLPQSVVVQFDAHLDIHHFRDCSEELSHGNFLLHAEEKLPPILNIGHRDLLLPAGYVAKTFTGAIPATQLALNPQAVREKLLHFVGDARVFVDIDCDVFDPIFFPAVGRSVPLGPSPAAVVALLEILSWDRVGGVCFSEFDPARDHDERCLATLVWLVEYLLLRRYEQTAGR